jgi:hypothetical protein
MSWFHDEKMTDKVDIVKRHIALLDEELKEKFGEGFDYATEDKLLDVIYDILKEKGVL